MKYVTLNRIKPETRFPIKAKSVLRYVELKSGYSDNGPAWIGYVKQSKTGRTLYFNGRGLMKLKGQRLPTKQKERLKLMHGSLMYRDKRLAGYDAATVVEVIEHLDSPRLAAFERVLFEAARPKTVVVTTPNAEYNVKFDTLPAGQFHHKDHRFEWTRQQFQQWAHQISERILLPRETDGLDVRVSEGMLERALQVMSQVLIVLDRQAFSVEVSEGHTVAVINGQRVCFGIEEPIRKVVNQKARVPKPTDRWDYDEVVTYEPAGKLVLMIHANLSKEYEQRTRWSDAKIQRIENLIGDLVAGLMRTAVAIRRQEAAWKQREAERDRRAREAEQLRKDIQEEEKKLEQFNQWVENWEHAERLRRFIAVYAEKSPSWSAEKQEKYKAWLGWARKQADRLDPFVLERPPSVLDRKHEIY